MEEQIVQSFVEGDETWKNLSVLHSHKSSTMLFEVQSKSQT